MLLLLALLGLVAQPVPLAAPMYPGMENLSTVRHLRCDQGTGSAFIVGRDVIATARHVATMTNCRDAETGNKYIMYHQDEAHDFALMTGMTPDMEPAKVNCNGYVPGREYVAQGITSYKQRWPLFRRVTTTARGITNLEVQGDPVLGIRELDGYIVPGMSGGPIHDVRTGQIVGIVNVGYFNRFGDPTGLSYSYELKDTILCSK